MHPYYARMMAFRAFMEYEKVNYAADLGEELSSETPKVFWSGIEPSATTNTTNREFDHDQIARSPRR